MKAFLLIALWWLIGFSGFTFWWTKQHDLTVGMAAFGAVVGGALGPLAWGAGWVVHGDHDGPPTVLIEKRQ